MKGWPALFALAGCARIFGLEIVDNTGDDGDGTPLTGTLEYAQVVAIGGTYQLVDTPEQLGISLGLVDAAGAISRIDIDASGAFRGTLTAPGPYRLQYGSPAGYPEELQAASAMLALRDPAVDRLVRDPVTSPTSVMCDLSAFAVDDAGDRWGAIISTGVRSFDEFQGQTEASTGFGVDWSTVTATDGRLAGALHTNEDGLWCVHYEVENHDSDTIRFLVATDAVEDTGGLTSGQVIMLPGGAGWTATPPIACATVASAPQIDADALAAAMQLTSPAVSHDTRFYSVPAVGLGLAGILPVAYQLDSNTDAYSDTFAVPGVFPGETLVAYDEVLVDRTYQVGNQTITARGAANRIVAVPGATCIGGPQPNLDLSTLVVPIPTAATLAGKALTVDDQHVTIDRTQAGVPFTFESSVPFDDVIVTVFEIGGSPPILAPRLAIRAGTNQVQIDPQILVANHTYAIAVNARIGFPKAAMGDFSRDVLPTTSGGIFLTSFVAD